jgi:phage protein U
MLYMLGTLTVDTRPFSIDAMERASDASIVAKPVIGGAQPKEFTGEGEDDITISGEILPFHIGGLNHLETAHAMRKAGTRFPLLRGDGWAPGWYAITKISEKHSELGRNGVGFKVAHSITMTKTGMDTATGYQVISGLLSLFSAFR